jgi:hypothetical protein
LFAGFVTESSKDDNSQGNNLFGNIAGSIFDYSYLNINRVEKLTLGINYSIDFFDEKFSIKSFAGYSLGVKKPLGSLTINYSVDDFIIDRFEFEIYHKVQEWQRIQPYSHLLNSAAVLLGFDDQFNYYLSYGFEFGMIKRLGKNLSTSLSFIAENQLHLKEKKYISIFNSNRFVRINPELNEGFDRKISLSLLYGKSPLEFSVIRKEGAILNMEISDKSLKSDFDYYKIFFAGEINAKTFYEELFVSPYLQLNAEAGFINGTYGIQQILTPVVSLGFYSPVTAFKGLKPYTFVGDKMIALHLEHNWRTIIFQALGIDFLTNLDLDIITGAGGLFISNNTKYFSSFYGEKSYWETFIGISRIFAILRIDFSYNSNRHFYTTLSTAIIF